MNSATLEIVGTVHRSRVFVLSFVTGLALAVVTGVPSGSQNQSEICCFICDTSAHSNCVGAPSTPKEGEALECPFLVHQHQL